MHPILARLGRLAAYLAAWIPLAAMLVYLLAISGGFAAGPVAAAIAPAALVYAFVCLSTWFSCRLLPLERSATFRVAAIHGVAAWFAGAVWGWATARWSELALQPFGWPAAERARFAAQATPVLIGAGVLLYLLAVAFHYILLASEARREAERREREARVLASEAELRALKAQLNPHFLFNSLNSISALTSADPAGAREMCVLLADFLRRTLGLADRAAIPLGDELALARGFLTIEQVRFGPRLSVEEDIEPSAAPCLVPPLLLQPLVENAIKHGVASLPGGGFVRLEARRAGARLSVAVENLFDPECAAKKATGVGLANVRRRLETRYGDTASVRIFTNNNRYRVRISLPAEENL